MNRITLLTGVAFSHADLEAQARTAAAHRGGLLEAAIKFTQAHMGSNSGAGFGAGEPVNLTGKDRYRVSKATRTTTNHGRVRIESLATCIIAAASLRPHIKDFNPSPYRVTHPAIDNQVESVLVEAPPEPLPTASECIRQGCRNREASPGTVHCDDHLGGCVSVVRLNSLSGDPAVIFNDSLGRCAVRGPSYWDKTVAIRASEESWGYSLADEQVNLATAEARAAKFFGGAKSVGRVASWVRALAGYAVGRLKRKSAP